MPVATACPEDDDVVVAHWEVYDRGVVLRYDEQRPTDEYGFLADQPFDPETATEEGVEELDEDQYRAATAPLVRRLPQD